MVKGVNNLLLLSRLSSWQSLEFCFRQFGKSLQANLKIALSNLLKVVKRFLELLMSLFQNYAVAHPLIAGAK